MVNLNEKNAAQKEALRKDYADEELYNMMFSMELEDPDKVTAAALAVIAREMVMARWAREEE